MSVAPSIAPTPLRDAGLAAVLGLALLFTAPTEARSQEGHGMAEAPAIATVSDLESDAAALERAAAALREATARFRDVEVALAEGYIRDPMNLCVSAETEGFPRQLGGMGVHFLRPDLLGITATAPRVDGTGTHTDFESPGVLVYFPDENGELRLGAVENLVFQASWKAAGHTERPAYHGQQYWTMVDNPSTPGVDEAHMFQPHYELHLWVHFENPAGIASQFNPRVSCAAYDGPKTLEEGIAWAQAHAPPSGNP